MFCKCLHFYAQLSPSVFSFISFHFYLPFSLVIKSALFEDIFTEACQAWNLGVYVINLGAVDYGNF